MTRAAAKLSLRCALLGTVLALAACGGGSGGGGGGAGGGGSGSGGSGSTTYTLGGTVSGLGGASGLVLADGGTTLTVPAGATSFLFATAFAAGTTYDVSVQSAPTGMTCTVAGGSGTLNANVANVVVTCSDNAYTLGGSIVMAPGSSGATISGLVLANGNDLLDVPTGASSFTMPTPVAYGSSYQVTVKTQPTGMSCSVSPSTPSTMPASNVTSVVVTCSDQPYQLGGTVTINQPPGVTLSDQGMVIDNTSNGDSYTFSSNSASFTMPKAVPYGAAYSLTVATQPTGLTCAINNPSGTMPAGNVSVTVTCSYLSYTISGTVTINAPSGVSLSDQGMVLTNTGNGDTYTFTSNAASFTMPQSMPYGATYNITVTTQPANLDCTVSNGTGTMPAANVTNVAVTCADQTYTLGGSITGLGAASGLVLTNEGTDPTTILANATTFTMTTPVPYGAAYNVAVESNPPDVNCTVSNGTGTMPAANVTTVAVTCQAGTESVLHSFGASGDAAKPYGTLIQASDGNFYGLSQIGGADNDGAVVKITSSGTETVLYSFGSQAGDGVGPKGSLIQASDGNFYGMTAAGGANGAGTVFEVTPSGTETVLHSFGGTVGGVADGATPYGDLLQASDGNLYGMTSAGGANGTGVVFEINFSTHAYSLLYSFGAQTHDGANPYGSLIEVNGTLYGMTAGGGANSLGTVFAFNPTTNTETPLYAFGTTATDGANPYGSLLAGSNGTLYGLTSGGGANSGGVIFEFDPATDTETVLHAFGTSGDGEFPYGTLIQTSNGNFYGMTELGGASGQGTVFELTSGGTESVLHSFGGAGDGAQPYGSLLEASNGTLYGLTVLGGTNSLGTVITIN